ncbi:MAG TPA: cytochrome c [Gemmatimonadaceae bacterium]|nr:cytochrome c [Gemmatimonadaceae bacterium]
MSLLRTTSIAGRALAMSFVVVAFAGHASTARAQHNGEPWNAPERAAHRSNPVLATDAAVDRGQMLFHQSCELCHGPKGKGNGPMSTSLPIKPADLSSDHVQSQTDGALFWKVLSGRGMMPSTQSTLTDEQRWAVIDYLRTLAPKRQ